MSVNGDVRDIVVEMPTAKANTVEEAKVQVVLVEVAL